MNHALTHHFRQAPTLTLLLLACFICQLQVRANPTGGTVTQGAATFTTSGSQFTINQSSGSAFINWQSFNIGAGETTTFVQPSASAVAWNQINGASPSQILGNLNANGYVILQNPNGFYIGGQAAITAHGLVMTTASTPAINLSSAGPWSFNTPPPAAKIINYGRINIAGGGSAFLIASDIENNGTVSAPGGNIGLYAGQHVLVSMAPDGRGLSAEVTLPTGSVDNEGNLIADAGSIAAQAQVVNQNGLIQANSVQNHNGVIELVAADQLNLGAHSQISANGDNAASGSSGGDVTLKSGNTFSDEAGSQISVTGGAAGGNGGNVEISAVNVLSLNSGIDARAQAGWTAGKLLLDPDYIILDTSGAGSAGTGTVLAGDNPGSTLDLNVNSAFGNLAVSQIILQAAYDITLTGGTVWNLSQTIGANFGGVTGGQLTLEAGRNIILGTGAQITDANNWSVTLQAGYDFVNQVVQPGVGTIYLNGGSSIQTHNGNITLQAGAMQTQNAGNVALAAADGNIELGSVWTLTDPGVAATLNLTAGNSINLDTGSGITAGNNWSVNLTAGTALAPGTLPTSGNDGIYLNDGSYIKTQNGNINLWAANEVQVGWTGEASAPGTVNSGSGGITTAKGGNISVTTLYGDVNTGSDSHGFIYQNTSPYCTADPNLGGISTAAGGNVTITAGGDVISYNPSGITLAGDAGTGAFGSQQSGNVTITAGGNVYGHYVLANGLGTVTAGNDVGVPSGGGSFALSLIDGSWNVNAPNGNIYLQEVRNPNGLFNTVTPRRGQPSTQNLFTYGLQDAVDLTAGIGVYLTDLNIPRLAADPIPVLYPPILDITAGPGGVTLQGNVTLFPSPDQNLNITTTDGGSLVSAPNNAGTIPELLMSDSSQTRWVSSQSFLDGDHGTGVPVVLNNPNPVIINISGSMEGLNLITTKATEITVGGDMINCGFSGQNLQPGEVTSITVAGQIYNRSPYSFIYGINIPGLPAADLPIGMANSWDDIFTLAVSPAAIAGLTLPSNITPSQYLNYALESAGLFQVVLLSNGQLLGNNPGFVYNPATGRFGFAGQMPQSTLSALTQPITILHLVNGAPCSSISTGHFETDTVTWVASAEIASLFQSSLGAPSPQVGQLGYRIGGPGQFDINAGSISLGNTYGILSCGVSDPGGFGRYGNLAPLTLEGATVNVTVAGNLDMLTSTIASLGGGDVNVTSTGGSMDLGSQELFNIRRAVGLGIYTSGGGNVNVIALGDVDINGSRIGTFDGGDIFVESLAGSVNVGSGGNSVNSVYVSYVNPVTGLAQTYAESVYGSGIVANTLVPAQPGTGQYWPPNPATLPGNITVLTPQGDIIASLGGILQEALNGSITAGPTINLIAGTPASGIPGQPGYIPGYVGNIDLGNSGVIGGTVNLTANGNIYGLIISRQNSSVNAAQSFSGTLLSAGSVSLSAGGTVSGTIIGVGATTVSSAIGAISADVLGQNVSVGGAKLDTLGSSATATSSSQSAASQAGSQAEQQVASNDTGDDDEKKKKKKPQIQHSGRVTVIISAAVPAR